MYKNYLKIWLRNLLKNKVYSFITISGLAIGLAVCTLLLLYVQDEMSYDHFHKNGNRIYRLCNTDNIYHAPQIAKLLAENFSEIEDYCRILPRPYRIVQYKEKRFKEKQFAYADASLFRMFSFKFKKGNAETALQEPYSIVISEKIAQKYFGEKEPIGKILTLNSEHNYTVTGVMEEMPHNSHFRYQFFATLSDAENIFGIDWMNNWGWQNFPTYFLLHPEFSKSDFEIKSSQFITKCQNKRSDQPLPKYIFQPLTDIHLHSAHIDNDIQSQSNITYVLIFSGIGVLILLIACFNYINMLTVHATTRAKEIAIKKVVGATRKQLAVQFVGESIIILVVAFMLSLIAVEICLPTFNLLTGKNLSFISLFQMKMIISILGILAFTCVIAGSYPAFVLSTFQPVHILKTSKSEGKSWFHFRKILVGTQFTFVIVLIICAILMMRQLGYLQNKKLGFEKEFILVSEVHEFADIEKFKSLKNTLQQQNDVLSVSVASRVPSDNLNNWASFLPDGQAEWINMPIVHISYDYFETLGITASQGRLFSESMQTDINDALILNKTAVRKLILPEESIGAGIQNSWPYSKRKVIGIVNDFHFESLYETIQPVAFVIHYSECWKLMVKVRSAYTKKVIENLQAICQSYYPEWLFEFRFLDKRLESIYQAEHRTFRLMGYFTALAIFIACMGLFGLASFMIKSRTKEIGVRKVLGASILQILRSLIRDFSKWILLANLVAWPVAYYFMNKWLQNFAYQIEMSWPREITGLDFLKMFLQDPITGFHFLFSEVFISQGWWMFVLAGVLALVIAILTVSWQAVRAAMANPVESLRYE